MNIREVEEATGLVRANIRYYEQEGFFTSERRSNGYRDYTDENVEVLKRIKLLRMLQMPIEEIRQVQSDELLMRTALERSIRRVEAKKRELDSAQKICRQMNEDRVTWETLKADRYLDQFGKTEEEKEKFCINDYPVYRPANLRRFFARMLDLELYTAIVVAVYYLILDPGVHLTTINTTVSGIFAMVLMLLLEPVFLRWLGTTPGKWLLGIYVHHVSGNLLTVADGRKRTWKALLWGCGLFIPIFSLIRLIKSAFNNLDAKELPWDEGGAYEVETTEWNNLKTQVLHIGGVILAGIALTFGQAYLMVDAQYPVRRGPLTKAELVENINDYLDETGVYSRYNLSEDLQWEEIEQNPGTVYIDLWATVKPQLEIVETDGYVTEISFTQTVTEAGFISTYDGLIKVLMLAYGGAQSDVNLWNSNLRTMLGLITDNEGNFSTEIAGLELYYHIENHGYSFVTGGGAYGEEGKEHSLTVTFSMTLTEED